MSNTLILIIAAAAALGIFILGMSITLILKGHHIQSEIGDNPNMKKLGIKCALRETLEEERALRGPDACLPNLSCGTDTDCNTCDK